MHAPHDLRRPTLTPRTRGTIGLAASLAALFGAGVVTTVALRPTSPPAVEVTQPISIQAPATATMVVPFTIPSIVVLPAPSPPPAPEPGAVEPPTPRALVPSINTACVVNVDASGTCAWDDGFPAISDDGTLIAIKYIPDDGGRGYPGLTIKLLDAKTSRAVSTFVVLSPDEYLESDDAGWPKLNAKIGKRAAAAQRALDARQFRTLATFGRDLELIDGEPNPLSGAITGVAGAAPLRAERLADAVRIIDTQAHTIVWQHRFPVEAEYPLAGHALEQEGCYPASTRAIGLAWDAPTRTVVAEVSYASGPCYCGDDVSFYVFRL